ncbi:hypothetical protein CEP54_003737 [Fusarium duplospermum]|uniref:Heterokaryon incompatibility domain-containing protein n=1 Tax=Fusarium duplospermum TaxID=1325734 RepID=A0A428QMT2_9HYPO|nr:hypothetical protein CEP54_003737 [Fusarium duplospermum]
MTQLKREIQLIELPKCFQEAITAARRLGGQYLWIDSLCIIQDSPHDWAIESEQMHRVYSNGICNLAASNQSISNRGLFCNRDPTMGSPFTVDSFWSDGTRAEKYVLNPNFAHLFTSYGPLYRRAWVVQEQQLSPRTIHMTPFPVWECREAILTEHFPSTEAFDVPLVDVLSVDTQPNNGDHFGQLCGGSLTLDGVLFEFPRISDMLLDHPNFVRKTSYNVDALALDDCGVDDYGGSDTWFLPLAVTSAASRHPGLNICGIILQKARGNSETAAYTRIGRAVVSHDGDIAGSGWLIRDWISRPWSKDYYQTIEIV